MSDAKGTGRGGGIERAVTENELEESLACRAAWLHYVGGLTQAAVAKRLGLPSVKTHRLIARAVASGVVKVSIDGDIIECVELEAELCRRFHLDHCEVAPDLGEEGIPLRALGQAGAGFLRREIERGDHRTIGLSHGRTLTSAVAHMSRIAAGQMRFVSLLGVLTRNYAVNPHDVMHSIAEKTGAQAYVMPVPFFANSAEDKAVLLAQRGISDVLAMANGAELKVVGIGSVDADAQLVSSGMMHPQEIRDIKAEGGVGEMLGYFFDAQGRVLENPLTARTLGVALNGRADDHVVGIAGGAHKLEAIRAVLLSGRLRGLITDEATARALLG
ncbi:sugar-binding transcriptional regulator [Labrys neptuniae]|uniref:sugar-binding transcriptional regulator n=1 Tax=Labrys neptuniae TaxID=376174 RepID=UPI002890DCAE|nr:sugar-binding transcriptional regulator [Labrys neptuniae]MDT3378221.1 sugar-binding transcriptional regulator [Labrys neptuniae]